MSSIKSPVSAPEWSVHSWKQFPIQQQPEYKDQKLLQECITKIQSLPPLVHPNEIDSLKRQLAQAANGERFVLQGGDCAERFQDCSTDPIEAKLKIILQMSLVLVWGARIPTLRIGRVAGQYGKPRSSPTETVNGREMVCFKGDNINGFDATDQAREHDPKRLVEGHFHSACTLNYIRALIKSGYADLHHARAWDLGFVQDSTRRTQYAEISSRILDSLDFMKTVGVDESSSAVGTVDYFTSHEGLVLDYEAAVTKRSNDRYYNVGSHFIWIGDRTRQLDGAHIEYFRGIANPIGVKVGPSMKPEELVQLIRKLDPHNEPGRITLISRFGTEKVQAHLPALVKAVQDAQLRVLWICDPMHGNTHKTASGLKTRSFDAILEELIQTFHIHNRLGSRLGGVHFELTGENVTECIGGPQNLEAHDLHINYTTYCDPRLNYAQGMEVAFRLAQMLHGSRHGTSPAIDSLSVHAHSKQALRGLPPLSLELDSAPPASSPSPQS